MHSIRDKSDVKMLHNFCENFGSSEFLSVVWSASARVTLFHSESYDTADQPIKISKSKMRKRKGTMHPMSLKNDEKFRSFSG